MKTKRKALRKPKPKRTATQGGSLGDNLKRARMAKGVTQLALAHEIGYQGDDAGACISRWENNDQAPTLENLSRIAQALGVTVCSLLAK